MEILSVCVFYTRNYRVFFDFIWYRKSAVKVIRRFSFLSLSVKCTAHELPVELIFFKQLIGKNSS